MRTFKLQTQVSVDGFMAGPGGEMDWMAGPWSDDMTACVSALDEPVDTILLGRNLAEGFIPTWAAGPEGETQESIDKMNKTPKVVISRSAGGWKVNAELPGPAGFAAATRFATPDDVAGAIPCGPDVGAHVEAVRPFVDAGFTHVGLVQVGGPTQPEFVAFAERELLPALREEFGKAEAATIRVR